MILTHLLIIALGVIVVSTAIIALISFILWENGFRILGLWLITRFMMAIILIMWAAHFVTGVPA